LDDTEGRFARRTADVDLVGRGVGVLLPSLQRGLVRLLERHGPRPPVAVPVGRGTLRPARLGDSNILRYSSAARLFAERLGSRTDPRTPARHAHGRRAGEWYGSAQP